MAIRKIYLMEYADAVKEDPDHWNGKSPSYTGAITGLSRAGVYKACKEDRLDAVHILSEEMHRLATIITNESIDRYLQNHPQH